MTESILTSVKKVIGIHEEDESFDLNIIQCINSVFMTLRQIGVGPRTGYVVKDKTQTWDEFLDGSTLLEAAKTYTGIQCRLVFDPPSNTALKDALREAAKEWEVRLCIEADEIQNGITEGGTTACT